MQEKDALYKALDRILDKQHRIVNTMVRMAEAEVNREPVRDIEYGLLKKEFEALAEEYRSLRDAANEYKEKKYKESTDVFGTQMAALTSEESKDAKSDDTMILDVRQEILDYIREAYSDMSYITDIAEDIYSIYDGKPDEKFRILEYESYTQNIHVIEHKDMFDAFDGDYRLLPFWARASIIEELTNTDAYNTSLKGLTKMVAAFDNPDFHKKLLPEEREELRKRVIYKKYEEMYLALNQYYNGLLTPEMEITGYIEAAKKTGGIPLFLGVTQSEFKLNHDHKVDEYIVGIKEELHEELLDVTKKRRRIKVIPRKLTAEEIKERDINKSDLKTSKDKKRNKIEKTTRKDKKFGSDNEVR